MQTKIPVTQKERQLLKFFIACTKTIVLSRELARRHNYPQIIKRKKTKR